VGSSGNRVGAQDPLQDVQCRLGGLVRRRLRFLYGPHERVGGDGVAVGDVQDPPVGGPLDPVPRDQVGDGVQHAELFGQQPQIGAGDDGPAAAALPRQIEGAQCF